MIARQNPWLPTSALLFCAQWVCNTRRLRSKVLGSDPAKLDTRMSKLLDYSKWDKIQDSDSDEDLKPRGRLPQVTKFETPMSVKIGPEGDDSIPVIPQCPAPPKPVGPENAAPTTQSGSATSKRKILDPGMLTENGAELEQYMWSQSRKEVMLRVWVPSGTKAKDVRVVYEEPKLTVSHMGKVLVCGELANPIKVEPESDLDWELTDSLEGPGGRRLVEVALVKSTMRDDMIHWWKQVFQGDPEIDTQKIKGRTSGFQDAWKEAQARFMESVKQKQPLVL